MDCIKIFFNDALESEVKIFSDTTTIGRASENDIQISNSAVSSRHAVIKKTGSSYVIEDCGSKNGTFVNGQRVVRQILKYGDTIRIVKHNLKMTPWIGPSESSLSHCNTVQAMDHNGTIQVDLKQIAALTGNRAGKNNDQLTGHLVVLGENGAKQKIPLGREIFTVGKKPGCDLPAKGWFAPGVSAQLKRIGEGHFIYPNKWGKVVINGTGINQPTKLITGDNLKIRDLSLLYL